MDPLVFRQACKRLKFKPSADLFASATHKQLHRYYSRTPDPKALGTNALSFDWQAESAPYANPPWSLIPQVLSKIVADEVRLMLVVPEWPRAHGSLCSAACWNVSSVWTAPLPYR